MPLPPVEAVEPVPIPEALQNRFVGPLLQMEIDGAIIASGPLPGLDGGPADRTKTHFGQQHGFTRSLVDGLDLARNGPSPADSVARSVASSSKVRGKKALMPM